MGLIAGFDIGGTKCSAVIGIEGNGGMQILDKRTFATADFALPSQAMRKLELELGALVKNQKIEALGISCGGPLDSKQGLILSPPNLPGWEHVAICDHFREKLGVPVKLQNDANACALAEWRYGAGRGSENFVFFTFGTGLGAGIILNGALIEGNRGMAGEIGHWRMHEGGPVGYGKAGSLEGFCSGNGIAQLAQSRLLELQQQGKTHPLSSDEGMPSAKEVFALAAKNDELCMGIVTQIATEFGKALAMLIDLLNPEVIVAGSIFTRNYALLHPIVRQVIDREALTFSASCCQVLPALLGESIGDVAALAIASRL